MSKILIMEGGQIRPVESTKFLLEEKLHDYLEQFPELVPFDEVEDRPAKITVIGREVAVPSGSIDLSFLDLKGRLTVVETKLAKNPEARREVIGQIIEYASFVSQWSYDHLEREALKYFASKGKVFTSLHEAVFSTSTEGVETVEEDLFTTQVDDNLGRGSVRLVIAVDELVESLRSTVAFLNSYTSFDILVLQLHDFELDAAKHVFIPSLYGQVATTKRRRRIDWNWENYRTELEWSEEQIHRAQSLLDRLERSSPVEPVSRKFHKGWVGVYVDNAQPFGIQLYPTGMEIWFELGFNPLTNVPAGVDALQRSPRYLHFSGDIEQLTDEQLARLCAAALKRAVDEPHPTNA
jgi:hypothetical protein